MNEEIEDCRSEYTDFLSVKASENARPMLYGYSHPVRNQTFFLVSKKDYRPKCLSLPCDLKSDEFVGKKNEEERNQLRQLHFEVLQFHHLIRQKSMEVEEALYKINSEIIHGALALEVEQ